MVKTYSESSTNDKLKGKFKPVSVQEDLDPMLSNKQCIENNSNDRSSFLDSTSTNKSSDVFAKQVSLDETE